MSELHLVRAFRDMTRQRDRARERARRWRARFHEVIDQLGWTQHCAATQHNMIHALLVEVDDMRWSASACELACQVRAGLRELGCDSVGGEDDEDDEAA